MKTNDYGYLARKLADIFIEIIPDINLPREYLIALIWDNLLKGSEKK